MATKRQVTTEQFTVHPTSIIDQPCTIGYGTKIWHFCHISSGATVGSGCTIGQNVYISGKSIIGNNVKIQNNVSVYDGVTIEDDVFCGPSMVFTNDINPRAKFPKHGNYQKTVVREGASIGANATIVCGITIGKHSFIGSGSVVTKNIPDYALAYGVPAQVHGYVCECGERLPFTGSIATCGSCGLGYVQDENGNVKRQ